MKEYFAKVPAYPDRLLLRRYRMHRSLFVRIVEASEKNCRYFVQRRNAAGLLGFSSYQKTAAMRIIAYGVPTNYTDEYLLMAKIPRSNVCECLPKH